MEQDPNDGARKYFELVEHEFLTLRVEWRLYRSFFGTNKETVDLFNAISGPTANTLESILFERTLLGLRRLTDPFTDRKRKRSSITIRGLPTFFGQEDEELNAKISLAVQETKFAKNWSDKRIAHADLQHKEGTSRLLVASRAKVEKALTSISLVLKYISREHYQTHLVTHPISPLNDERQFLKALYLGQKVIEKQKTDRERLLQDRDYERLDALREEIRALPSWLQREDPPVDYD